MKRVATKIILSVTLCALSALKSSAALIPPYFFTAVVSLGSMQPVIELGKPPTTKWVTEGTGFFYGYLVRGDPDVAKRQYEVFLITAGHVVRSHPMGPDGTISIRVDATDAGVKAQDFQIPISNWFFHPSSDVDLAAVPISIETLRSLKLDVGFFASDLHAFTKDQLREAQVSAGDGIFILGFPMGQSGQVRNYTIVRQGAIARISEYLDGASKSFLVDSFVFPGNSGGPVVLKPELTSITGTKANQKAMLIGVVQGYETYIDIALSQQTKRQRIAFEENSGLAIVFPVEFINELVKTRAEADWKDQQAKANPPETAPMPEDAPAK